MKRALSFLLSFAMMFSAFAPAVSAMEDIPSVASNESTVVEYAVNGDEQYGQVNGNIVHVNEMGMITFTAKDENGDQINISGITVDPQKYNSTNILDNGIAVVGVSEGASAEELYTVTVEVSDGTEATMYYVAEPNTPAVEPEQPSDDGVLSGYVLTGPDDKLDAKQLTGPHDMTQGSYCGIAFAVDGEYMDAADVSLYLTESMGAAGFRPEMASGTLKDGTEVSFWYLYSDNTTPTGEYTAVFEIQGEEFPVTINVTAGNNSGTEEPDTGFEFNGQFTGNAYWRFAGESQWNTLSEGKSYCAADAIVADVFQEIELKFEVNGANVTNSIWFPNGDPENMFEMPDEENGILRLRTDSTAVLRNLKEGFVYQTDFAVNDGQHYIFQFTVQEEEVTLPTTAFSGTAKIIVGSHDAPEYIDFNNFGAGATENNCLGVKFFDTNSTPVDANRVKPVISSLPAGIDIHWGYDNWTAENGSTGIYNEWEFWFNENIQPGSYDMQFIIDDSYTATVTLTVIEDGGEGPGAGGEEIEYFGDQHVYWWRGANMSEEDAVEYGWTSSNLEVIEISTDNTLFIRTKDSNGTIVPVNGWSFIDVTDSDLAGLDWGGNDFGDFRVIIGENAAPGQRTVKISNAMGEFVFCFEIVADEGGEGGDGDEGGEGEENGYFDWAYGTSQMLPSSGKVKLGIVEFGPGNATGDVFVAKYIEDGDRFEILGDVYQSIISVDKNGNGGPLSCTVNIDLAREIYGESGDFWINLSLVTDNGPTQTWGFKIGGEDDDTPEEEPDNTDAPYAKWANGLESSDDFVVPQDSTFTAPIETGNITDQTVAVLLGYVDEETEGNPFVPFETQKGLSFTYDENGLPTSCTFDGEVIAQEYPNLASQGWFHVAIVVTYKDGGKLTGGRDVAFPGENTGEGGHGYWLEWDLDDTDGEMFVLPENTLTTYNIINTSDGGTEYARVLLGLVDPDTGDFVPYTTQKGIYPVYDSNGIPTSCSFNGAEIMEYYYEAYRDGYFHVAIVTYNDLDERISSSGRDVPLEDASSDKHENGIIVTVNGEEFLYDGETPVDVFYGMPLQLSFREDGNNISTSNAVIDQSSIDGFREHCGMIITKYGDYYDIETTGAEIEGGFVLYAYVNDEEVEIRFNVIVPMVYWSLNGDTPTEWNGNPIRATADQIVSAFVMNSAGHKFELSNIDFVDTNGITYTTPSAEEIRVDLSQARTGVNRFTFNAAGRDFVFTCRLSDPMAYDSILVEQDGERSYYYEGYEPFQAEQGDSFDLIFSFNGRDVSTDIVTISDEGRAALAQDGIIVTDNGDRYTFDLSGAATGEYTAYFIANSAQSIGFNFTVEAGSSNVPPVVHTLFSVNDKAYDEMFLGDDITTFKGDAVYVKVYNETSDETFPVTAVTPDSGTTSTTGISWEILNDGTVKFNVGNNAAEYNSYGFNLAAGGTSWGFALYVAPAYDGVRVEGTHGKLKWTLYIDGGLEITGSGAIPNLEPALDENDYLVNPHPWGAYADDVTRITVADTVTSIGDCAFMNMKDVEEVTLGNKVTYIGDMAFANCQELAEITLPDTVKTIGNRAFAFTQLSEITLPANLEMIKDFVFQDTYISEIVIPAKVKSIAPYFFTDMFNLNSFSIDEANANLVFEDGIIWRISRGNKTAVVRALDEFIEEDFVLVIPETVTAIENYAFEGCSLEELFIPKSVTKIDEYAFSGETEYVYYSGTEAQWEALANKPEANYVFCNVERGIFSAKVTDATSGDASIVAPLQNIKRYNDDISLMYAFEISKFETGEIEWTVTSSNENVVDVVFVSDPWSYTEGAVEFETKDIALNVVGKGKAVVTFTAKDTLTNTTKTYKVTYNVTQMATGVELTVTGTKNRADEYALIAGKTLVPKIKWIGGNPWSADEYSFNIETEESIEDGIPVVDPVKGTVTTYADTKYDKVGNITAYATEPGSYVLTFVAAAEDADGNIVCDIVENIPIHVYTEMASAVNVDRTKVILAPMAHETETIISAEVENEGQACGDVAFTWTANDNFLVVDNGDNTVYVKLLNNNKGSITITATAMDDSKKSAKITVSSGVLVEYLDVATTLPEVYGEYEIVDDETGDTNVWDSAYTLAKGKTNKLTTTIAPSNATNKTVLWSSSDESVVTVDGNGTIKGVSAGAAIIRAESESGYAVDELCVLVTEPVTNVAIDWNNDFNAGVEIVESKGAITVPLGYVDEDNPKYIFLDSIISNANGIDADYPAEAIEWTVAGGNGIDSRWYEEYDDDGNLTVKKYVVAIFEAGKYTVTAKALDGTNKSAKLTINAEQHVFDMRVEAPAGIGVDDYSEEFADVGTVWVTTAGTKFAPTVVFNNGDKDRQPSKTHQAYEIILEGDAANYLTVAGKNVTAAAVPENSRCLTSFTVKAGDLEETINVVILPKGEQPIVNLEILFNNTDQHVVAAGTKIPVTTYINNKKGLPSGFKFVRWELKCCEVPVDSSMFTGTATSITFSEELNASDDYKLVMVLTDSLGNEEYIQKDITLTAKPKAEEINLRKVDYDPVYDAQGMLEDIIVTGYTDQFITDFVGDNALTPASPIMVFKLDVPANAYPYGYTFKSSNAKAVEIHDVWVMDNELGEPDWFVAVVPKASGKVTITATSADFSKVAAKLNFEIKAVNNPVKQIVTTEKAYNVDIHDVIEIDFNLIATNAGMPITDTEVEWTVSAPDILSICDGSQYDPEGESPFSGYITTTGESGSLVLDGFSDKTGKVVITGTAMDGSNKSVKINVTVEKEKVSGEDRLMLDVPANTPNGGENGVAILTWGKAMKLNSTILATNPKGKAVSYEVFAVTEPYGDVVEGAPSEITVDKNGTVKVGKYAINKKTGVEVIPYTGWIKVVGKLGYKQRSWNPETEKDEMMEIVDEVYIYVQQPATGLSVSYTENGELKTTTKAVTLTVPAGESITFTAEQLYGYAGGPDLEFDTAGWSMAANDFAYAYHPYDEDGEEYIEFKDMYTVDVLGDAPVNKTFRIKAFTQDGSNKNIQITIKVGEPL